MTILLITSLLVIAVITVIYLGARFHGPYLVRKLLPGCSVKSVSLRSIRGIRIDRGAHVIEIGRIGLSFGRRPNTSSSFAFRCSIQTTDVTCRSFEKESPRAAPLKLKKPPPPRDANPLRSRRSRFSIQNFALFTNSTNDTVAPPLTVVKQIAPSLARHLDGLLRPVFRILFVAAFRAVIRIVPVLMQAVDFELNRATLTLPRADDLTVLIEHVHLSTRVEFSDLELVVDDTTPEDADVSALRRLTRMGNWQLRLRGSWDRTWHRAWGRTSIIPGASIEIGHVEGTLQPRPAANGAISGTIAEPAAVSVFKIEGPSRLESSVKFIPGRATFERQSLDLEVALGQLSVDIDNALNSARRVSEVLAPKGTGLVRSPIPEDTISEEPLSPTSPISPILSAGSRARILIYRRRFQERAKKRGTLKFPEVFKNFDFRLPRFECTTSSSAGASAVDLPDRLHFIIKDIFAKGGISNPESHDMHRKWLGKSMTQEKGEALALESGFGTTTLGWMAPTGKTVVPLLTLDQFVLRALNTSWIPATRLDPNQCLLVVEATLAPLVVSGTMKDLRALEALSKRFASPSAPKPASASSPIMHIPRLIVDIHTGGFNMLFCLDNHGPQAASLAGVHLRVPQFELHGYSEFIHRPYVRRDQSREPYTESIHLVDAPYLLQFGVTGFIGPADLQIIFEDRVSAAQSGRHSMIRLAEVELRAKGDVLAAMPDTTQIPSVDRTALISRVQCASDSLVVDITNPVAISVLPDMLSVLPDREPPPVVVTRKKKPLLGILPAGVNAHFAIGTISCLASGRDLAPGNTKPVKRGIELRIGVALGYSLMHDRQHGFRTRGERHIATQHRDHLQLPADILCESTAISQQLNDAAGEKGAVVRLDAFNFQIRPIVDFANAFIPLCDWENKSTTVPTALLNIPQIRVDVLLKRSAVAHSTLHHDVCRVVADVRQIKLNLSLHHIYCIAVASTALPRLETKRAPRVEPQPRPSTDHDLTTHAVMNINNVQVRVDLPGTQKVYLCIEKTKVALRDPHREVSFGVLHGWALAADGRWDEVLRMRHLEVLAPTPETSHIAINGQGARLRIPHGFSFASLIQEISLMAKSSKHLFHIVKVGHFVAMGTPEAEDAKHVPPLVISINALVIEAADDPFETKLSLLWRAGSKEQQERMVREDAFKAKVEAIQVEVGDEPNSIASATGPHEWHFGGKHTIPIDEAYQRLQQFNSSAWISAYNTAKMAISKREETQLRQVGQIPGALNLDKPVPLDIRPIETVPPLIRLVFDGVRIDLVEPSFSGSSLPEFLKRTGDLPLDTQYTLLVPINLRWEMRYAMVTLRDYPLPLLHVRPNSDQSPSWTAFADIVIAEEIGPSDSVEWLPSTVVPEGLGFDEQPGFSLLVPKTGMPVKTYASPIVQVTSSYATDISWGVSYQPCVADVVRILDSLSHPSRDPSTPLGFWDKIRLSLHGKLRISFTAGLNLLVKGSRDPYEISGNGAGFALCWTGHPGIFVGYHLEEEKELVQFRGDRMVVGIPNLPSFAEPHSSSVEASSRPTSGGHAATLSQSGSQRPHMQKICAKLTNGVKLGLGFVLERNCGPDCTADHSLGACRKFDFRPHYSVKLRPSTGDPKIDSFAGFRSDYIHFSLSLISPMNASPSKAGYSSFHLSPKAFAHFFSWWYVFNPPNGPMLLPIRQGSLYPSDKPPPLKFTRHLVTIKYRFSLSPLFISHVYRQDSRASWATGITPCVGIKAVIESFKVDLHQRDQVETIRDEVTGRTKTKTHKPFYAVEVIAQGLDLRAMVAQFKEPEKPVVELPPPPNGETQTSSSARPPLPDSSRERLTSRWVDLDDFVETDWAPTDDRPGIWLFTAASCPRITYFKKPERLPTQDATHTTCAPPHKEVVSRFGNEDSHVCLMGSELSAIQVQAMMCHQRLKTLEEELSDVVSFREDTATIGTSYPNRVDKVEAEVLQSRQEALEKKIGLLREHLDKLESTEVHFAQRKMREAAWLSTGTLAKEYPAYFEVDIDWSQFDNIYQIHCPQVHLNNNTRNIILDYYYSSRNRRGFEYHLSERAVRFIREQSTAPPSKSPRTSQDSTTGPATKNRAQAAAHTIRKIFTAEGGSRDSSHLNVPQPIKCQGQGEVEPASGWKTEDIVVKKSHLCLLLNPQFTLRSTADAESILVITAAKASLQTFSILDKRFADSSVSDPINADIMKRNYGSLNGLQVFSPSRARDRTANSTPHEVPLEVLLDLRCESSDFDRLVAQTDVTLQYDKFNRLRLRNKVTSATAISAQDTDINNHLHAQNDRIILNVDKLAVSATAQNFVAIYNIVSDLLLYTDPDQRERTRQLQTFMYSYDFRDFSASAGVVSELQQRLRSLLDTQMRLAMSKGPMTDERLMTRAHIFLISEELNLIFKAIRLAQEQDENASDENKSNMRFDVFAQEISWKMLEDTNDTLAKVSVRGIEYAWHSQKDSSAANKLVITDLQALDSSPDAVFPEMLVKLDKSSSHPMITKSLFAQVEWSILAPVGGISIVNSFILDLHPVRLQIERKIGRKIMAYIFPRRAITAPNGPSASGATTPKPIGPSTPKSATMIVPGHKSRSSIGAIAGAGLGISSGVAGFPRGSIDNPSLDAGPRAPRTLRKKATSHSDLKEAAAESSPAVIGSADDTPRLEGRRPIPRSRSSHTLAADAKSSALTKGPSRGTRTLTGDKEKDPEAKDDANEMLVRASKNRSFVLVRVSGLVLALSYKRDTPISLTTVPDLDDFRFETPPFCYENETWSFEDMVEVLKKDIFKAAWAQKGALLREIFTKAKIITPRRFLPHDNRLGWTHRRKGKSSKPGAGDNELDKEKEPLDSEIDNLIEAMTSGSSAIPASRDPPSSFRRPQRPTARTSTSETSPIGFPGDQEPSPTPRSIASSRGSSISQTYAFPVSGEPSGRASSMDQVERSSPNTADPRPSSSAAQYFKFPSPPTSPAAASTSRPTRQRVLSLFKKGKKKELGLDDGGKPRQSLDVPDVPPLPGMGMGPRQRTISAHAKMQR